MKFDGLDALQHRIDNYDHWLIENDKSKIIVGFIRRCRIRHKFKQMFKIYKIVKSFIIQLKWKRTIKLYKIYMISYNAATIINRFVHRKYLRNQFRKTVLQYKIFFVKNQNAFIINRFMHKCYMKKQWNLVIRGALYYTREQKKFLVTQKKFVDKTNKLVKDVIQKIYKLSKEHQKIAYTNLEIRQSRINYQISLRDEEFCKLLRYNVNNNQPYLFGDLYVKNATTPYWKRICEAAEKINKMFYNFEDHVTTACVPSQERTNTKKKLQKMEHYEAPKHGMCSIQ